jgi:hypothetical protein
MIEIRAFNDDGTRRFREYVESTRLASRSGQLPGSVPNDLLHGDEFSATTEYRLPTLSGGFPDKIAIGSYFANAFPADHHHNLRLRANIWSWLAARFFDELTQGRRKIKETRAYIAGISYQDFYRHLLLGPYYIFHSAKDDPERVRVLLYDEPTTMNEVMVQFGSYQTLMQNPALQRVVQRLYFDNARGRIKRGAGGKTNGAPRRLMDFLRQIELNFDLPSVAEDRIMQMLPREFARFSGGLSLVS